MSEFDKDTPVSPASAPKDEATREEPAVSSASGAASGTGSMPGFLTREEYEQVGDDPEPLPKDFQVIDGGAGEKAGLANEPTALTGASDATADAGANPSVDVSAPVAEDPGEPSPSGAAAAANAVGAFITEGVTSVREVNAARRAHAEARGTLEQLDRSLEKQTAELEHRRDITERFGEIVAEQTARFERATTAKADAEAKLAELEQRGAELKTKLDAMKESDAATEKRLKSALDAAEAKEESARESGSRLQRRLDDARRNLEKAQSEREDGMAAAQRAIESAKSHISTLNAELAEVQKNPSANSAEYSVRSGELQGQISDAADELRLAQEELPRVTAETQAAIADAQAAVTEAEKPIDAAKKAYAAVSAEADRARDAYDAAKKDADARQKELRRQVSDAEKAAKEQRRAAEDAQAEAESAQVALDEANDIHAHPEATEALAHAVAADQAERGKLAAEVEHLAATERDVRERTRGSRVKFIGIITVVVALVLIAIILQFATPR